jgi:hypothetical protein
MLNKNQLEIAELFKTVDFEPVEHWADPPINTPTGKLYIFKFKIENYRKMEFTDKLQFNDPLFQIFSEVEHPVCMRAVLKKWRHGSEIKFKMPYYPQAKAPTESLRY